jgi:hypothetical protein
MNVLIVSAYYFPDFAANVSLMKDLSDCLAKVYNVDVLTNNSRSRIESCYINTDSKVKVYRRHNMFIKKSSKIFKILEYSNFIFNSILFISNRKEKYQIVFCQSTPPLMSIFIRFAYGKNKPIIYNVQDIFPDSLIPMIGEKRFAILHQLEKLSYLSATEITTISQNFAENIYSRSGKMATVFSNWIDIEKMKYIDNENNDVFKKYKRVINNRKTVVYSGNIGVNQDFDIIIKCAEELNDDSILFLIFGNGVLKRALKREIKKRNIRNILVLDPVPSNQINEVFSFGDLYILSMKKNALRGSFPSKTWNILSCGRDLVVAADIKSSFCSILNIENLAYVCDAGDYKSFSDNIILAIKRPLEKKTDQILYIKNNCLKELVLNRYLLFFNSLIIEAYDDKKCY